MSDKIKEIRDRHSKRSEIDQSGCYRLDGFTYTGSLAQSQEDAATLLAEVDRLRAEIERLRAALEGIRIDGPDAHGLVWATIQHPSIAARSHAMIGGMDRMVSQALLEFEQIRRKALEGKP